MTLIDELKVINYSIIDCMKTKGISLKKNMLIKEILKDEACFFKMEKKEAIVVLKNLKVSDDMIEETYKKLTDSNEFYRLCNTGIINENEKDLKIKYDFYNNNPVMSERKHNKQYSALIEIKKEKWYKKFFDFFRNIFMKNK